ncbi:hypothetical protein HDV05_000474 [Chytridiales sp. JEL 0842]|nr:hypothetical protein HDV05_000474 [Chytridiales sp. JEL 0842]
MTESATTSQNPFLAPLSPRAPEVHPSKLERPSSLPPPPPMPSSLLRRKVIHGQPLTNASAVALADTTKAPSALLNLANVEPIMPLPPSEPALAHVQETSVSKVSPSLATPAAEPVENPWRVSIDSLDMASTHHRTIDRLIGTASRKSNADGENNNMEMEMEMTRMTTATRDISAENQVSTSTLVPSDDTTEARQPDESIKDQHPKATRSWKFWRTWTSSDTATKDADNNESIGFNRSRQSSASSRKKTHFVFLGAVVLLAVTLGLVFGLVFGLRRKSNPASSDTTGNKDPAASVFEAEAPKAPDAGFAFGKRTEVSGRSVVFSPGNLTGRYVLAKGDGGSSGVSAIHVGLMKDTGKVVFIERWDIHSTEAILPNGNPAWSVEYDYTTDTFRPLRLQTNIFCAGGMMLPDGRLMVMGGAENFTELGGILNGERRVRILESSGSTKKNLETGEIEATTFGNADWWDDPNEPLLSLNDERWYPTALTLPEGRLIAIGGSVGGVQFTYPSNNSATFEFLPPLNPSSRSSTPLQFLWDTLPGNLYPFVAVLPSGRLFITAADRATLMDPRNQYEALPTFQISTTAGGTGWTFNNNGTLCLDPSGRSFGSAMGLARCFGNAQFNQNDTAVSEQTFAFFGEGVQLFKGDNVREDREGRLVLTSLRGCLARTGSGGGVLSVQECNLADDNQVFRLTTRGSIVHKNTNGCLLAKNSTVPFVFSPCNADTSAQRFRFVDSPLYFEFPKLPGGPHRSYPWTGMSAMLPLDPAENYEAKVLICGGSDNNLPPYTTSPNVPALKSCGMIRPDQPDATWSTGPDLHMLSPRVMGDLVNLPDGTILALNGAKQGMAGWDLGRSPNLDAELFIPTSSQKWRKLNSTTIPRLYHSSSMLLPDGRVLVAGSSPNSPTDKSYPALYKVEYRVEYFHPPYLTSNLPRPVFKAVSKEQVGYNETWTVHVDSDPPECPLEFSLVHVGFRTHSMSHGQRMIWLVKRSLREGSTDYKVGDYAVMSPPTPQIAPPGYYLLFGLCNGVPSVGVWVQVGGDPAGVAEYYKRP